ncbi:MAG TPA: hypothetical protein VF132_09470 [Rudaea sp.]
MIARAVPLVAALCFVPGLADAARLDAPIAAQACDAIAAHVDAVSGSAPLFLRSYDDTDEPALRTAAFTYDNALAVMALIACGKPVQAERVGRALRSAIVSDARLRNAYRAGPIDAQPLPNGWWDAAGQHWAQSPDQMGTSTGNAAWAALAMLALHDATGEAAWLDAARRIARWIADKSADAHGPGGFKGGIEGDDEHAHRVGWKSTEHNIDAAALFERLSAADPNAGWQTHADAARHFVTAQWSEDHFLIGTRDDSVTPNRDTAAVDVEFWPPLLRDAPKAWCASLAYAERVHGVDGGFDFNADRDGLWTEGTAQAALAYTQCGQVGAASRWLASVAAQRSAGGYIYATREARITTGLALGSASGNADFYYYRRPHLGATAWAVFAGRRWNPFTGKRVDLIVGSGASAKQ